MDRIIGANTIDLGGGKRGFRGKDTVAGIAGTELTAVWHNAIQEEVVGFIEKTGQAPNGANLTQLSIGARSQRLNYVTVVAGTANALSITLDPQPADWAALDGVPLRIKAAAANTVAGPTLAVTGLAGTKPFYTAEGLALPKGALKVDLLFEAVYVHALGQVVVTSVLAQTPQLNFFELTTLGTQSVPSSTLTVINDFAVTNSKASDAAFSAGGLVTIGAKTAGVWVFSQQYIPGQIGGPPSTVQAYLLKNGQNVQNQTVSGTFCSNSGTVRVAAGDVLSMGCWQNSGGGRLNRHPTAVPPDSFFNLYQISAA